MTAALFLIALLQSASDLLARGDYEAAIQQAQSAFDAHERAGAHVDAAWDLNDIGLANQYLGRYDAALDAYRRALALDRAAGNGDGEVTRLNNIGNVHFFLGRYSDADTSYAEAWRDVDAITSARERGRLRKMTLSNMAVLAQRLGSDERALDLYARIGANESMQPAEEAQLLVNRGALFRRLGDPVKALEFYGRAQQLFARAAHRDGEIGAWRNIGIARALELHDETGALEAFDAALRLADASGNRLRITQALLYRGESLRRAGRPDAADTNLRQALETATAGKMVEEQWKALYSIGLLHRAAGDTSAARSALERAVGIIESVRADLRTVTLRSEFLADRRDVYDALIWLRANEHPVDADALFALAERSRARTWQDRLAPRAAPPSLADVKAALPPDTALLEFASTADGTIAITVTSGDARVFVRPSTREERDAVETLPSRLAARDDRWRDASVAAGRALLDALPTDPRVTSLIVAADGPIQFVPFEALTLPAAPQLLVERWAVRYVPSAAWLTHAPRDSRRIVWPWQRVFVAFADPAAATAYPLEPQPLPALPYAASEVQRAARSLGGASELHVGADARKAFAAGDRLRRVPVIHFATHAVADTRDPERSRVLLAPSAAGAPPDYLFLRELQTFDLDGVSLVTLSACDTERGRVVRGEGVESFSRALLADGAHTTLTTLWSVADRPGAELMAQFYYFAGRHEATADALRDAKLRFLRSGTAWAHPYYWAGYLLNGDGGEPLPRVVSWTMLVAGAFVVALLLTGAIRAAGSSRSSRVLRPR